MDSTHNPLLVPPDVSAYADGEEGGGATSHYLKIAAAVSVTICCRCKTGTNMFMKCIQTIYAAKIL